MSMPYEFTNYLLGALSQESIINVVAQVDARRILQEVKELPENYPKYDPALTDKAVHIAYD